jgi:hypothetical protein
VRPSSAASASRTQLATPSHATIDVGGDLGSDLIALELDADAERLRACLQDLEQRLALDAAEAVARRAEHLAAGVDLDVVPAREAIGDLAVGLGVRGGEVPERGVGEHDAEPERVDGPVALVHDHLVLRRRALDEDAEIQPGGAAADAGDLLRPATNRSG